MVRKLILKINNLNYLFCVIYCCLFVLAVIGALSAVVALYWPGLQLPENSHFQLFVDDHPFEVYHTKLKNEFWFERSMIVSIAFLSYYITH